MNLEVKYFLSRSHLLVAIFSITNNIHSIFKPKPTHPLVPTLLVMGYTAG
jgi:hypothetical protein